jgi:hypothetical protein
MLFRLGRLEALILQLLREGLLVEAIKVRYRRSPRLLSPRLGAAYLSHASVTRLEALILRLLREGLLVEAIKVRHLGVDKKITLSSCQEITPDSDRHASGEDKWNCSVDSSVWDQSRRPYSGPDESSVPAPFSRAGLPAVPQAPAAAPRGPGRHPHPGLRQRRAQGRAGHTRSVGQLTGCTSVTWFRIDCECLD